MTSRAEIVGVLGVVPRRRTGGADSGQRQHEHNTQRPLY